MTKSISAIFFIFSMTIAVFSQTMSSTEQEFQKALKIVQEAAGNLGGIETLEKAKGVSWTGEGEFDLSTRMQGMSYERPDIVPLRERFAYDPATGKVAYENQTKVNPDADEKIRYLYSGDGRLRIVELQMRQVFWDTSPTVESQRIRYARAVPHFLLNEAIENRQSLRYAGGVKIDGQTFDAVNYAIDSGEILTLLFGQKDGNLKGLEYLIDHPLLGDTTVRWLFGDYKKIENLGLFPDSYKVFLGARHLKTVRLKNIQTNAENAEIFSIPKDIEVPEPPKIEPSAAASPPTTPPLPRVRELAEGVYLIVNVRGGFHVLAVEFKDFVMVVDTPAGYHELQQIPALDWAGEANSDAVGERLMQAVKKTIPGKPVRYVVLTHYHSDHTGGIRPFIEAGAKIVASPETVAVIRRAFGRKFSIASKDNETFPKTADFETVKAEQLISDGEHEAKIINIGKNPHVEGMLVVYLPKQKILYQSDLFEPIGMKNFPSPARVPVMKWFVRWLDDSGLKPDKIYSIHGSATVTEEHLAKIREMNKPQTED